MRRLRPRPDQAPLGYSKTQACAPASLATPFVLPALGTKEAPPGLTGRGLTERALLAVLARPRPQQSVAFATLVVEQVCVDRRVEGGVIELEREVVASFLGALRPGGTDLGVMWCTT